MFHHGQLTFAYQPESESLSRAKKLRTKSLLHARSSHIQESSENCRDDPSAVVCVGQLLLRCPWPTSGSTDLTITGSMANLFQVIDLLLKETDGGRGDGIFSDFFIQALDRNDNVVGKFVSGFVGTSVRKVNCHDDDPEDTDSATMIDTLRDINKVPLKWQAPEDVSENTRINFYYIIEASRDDPGSRPLYSAKIWPPQKSADVQLVSASSGGPSKLQAGTLAMAVFGAWLSR